MVLFRDKARVLLPLELPEPETLSERMLELLGSVDVLLVGWVEVPEQTPPEQAREQLDDDGSEALEAVAEKLRGEGATVEVEHVFTPDLVATVQRIGAEKSCEAALINGRLEKLDRILMVLREDVSAEFVGSFLSQLSGADPEKVTLLQISEHEADEGRDWSEEVLDRLSDRGIDTDRVATRVETADDPGERVLEICRDEDFDLVIVPERGEVEDRLFGSFAAHVARDAALPVLVVRGGGSAST